MLYLAIPAQNEVATIGVLLWRLRSVLAEFPREYEVVVYDDASADETADVAEQYAHAMPVTVLRGTKPVGYAGAVDALVRYVSGHTRYPRRDAMLLLQGDFTDPPGIVPEFARRFEGGADLVVGERTAVVDAPTPVKRLFSAAGWALRPFVRVDGIRDLTSSMRLVRISVLRDALRTAGDAPVCEGDSWTANADLLLRLVPHSRRVESVPMEPTYGVRMRETRRVTVRDALATLRWGWRARGRRAVPSTVPESATESTARPARGAAPSARRRDEPEMTAERLRERKRDRDRPRSDSGLEDTVEMARREKSRRDRRDARNATEPRETTAARDVAESAEERVARDDRKREKEAKDRGREKERTRDDSVRAEAGTDRNAERGSERRERGPKRGRGRDGTRDGVRDAARDDDLTRTLDDPFAAPASRRDARSETRSETPNASPSDARSDSPYADEPAPATVRSDTTRNAPPARTVVPPLVGANAAANAAANTAADDTAQDDGQDDIADADALDGDAEGGDSSEAATRERKRRRNRRSRKRKSRAQAGESAADGASTGDDGVNADSANAERTPSDARGTRRRSGGDVRDDAAVDDADSSDDAGDAMDDNEGASSAESGGSDADGAQARAKRRGRRGRRGGARRSRNRGKADGSAAGTSADDASSNDGGGSSGGGSDTGNSRPREDGADD